MAKRRSDGKGTTRQERGEHAHSDTGRGGRIWNDQRLITNYRQSLGGDSNARISKMVPLGGA